MSFTGDRVVATATDIDRQVTSGTTGSTSYTATLSGGTACGKAFIAPPSGRVELYLTAQMSNSTSGGYCFYSVNVRTGGSIGSGSLVFTSSDDEALTWNSTTVAGRSTCLVVVDGLTPGATYNAQGQYKVGSGTGTFLRKQLFVRPTA